MTSLLQTFDWPVMLSTRNTEQDPYEIFKTMPMMQLLQREIQDER